MKFIDKYQIPIFITMVIAGMLIIISTRSGKIVKKGRNKSTLF